MLEYVYGEQVYFISNSIQMYYPNDVYLSIPYNVAYSQCRILYNSIQFISIMYVRLYCILSYGSH